MRRLYIYAATFLVAATTNSFLSSCSNEDIIEQGNELTTSNVITKHVVFTVKGDSIAPEAASDKNSRFTITLPESGRGKIVYTFEEGEVMSAFTEDDNGHYIENTLKCKKAYDNGNAQFEGDIQYTKDKPTVYLWLGNQQDFRKTNSLIYLGDMAKKMPDGWVFDDDNPDDPNDPEYKAPEKKFAGITFSTNGVKWRETPVNLYQYGTTTMNEKGTFDRIQLNMVTSFVTIKFDEALVDNFLSGENYNIHITCDANNDAKAGFIQKPYFNFKAKELELFSSKDSYSNNYYKTITITKEAVEKIIEDYNGLLSFPLLVGNYPNFKISIDTEAFQEAYHWESTPWSFSTIIGAPTKVDDDDTNTFSSNRNFYFGTVNLQPVNAR